MNHRFSVSVPLGWCQVVAAVNTAAILYGAPQWIVTNDGAAAALYGFRPTRAPEPLLEVCEALAGLLGCLCEVCGAPTGSPALGRRTPRTSTPPVMLCPVHALPSPSGEGAAAWPRVPPWQVVLSERLVEGCFPLLDSGLEWRDVVHADAASLALQLRRLGRSLDGPVGEIIPWVWVAALQHAEPEAIVGLEPTDPLPLLACRAAPVRELGLRLLRQVETTSTGGGPARHG